MNAYHNGGCCGTSAAAAVHEQWLIIGSSDVRVLRPHISRAQVWNKSIDDISKGMISEAGSRATHIGYLHPNQLLSTGTQDRWPCA